MCKKKYVFFEKSLLIQFSPSKTGEKLKKYFPISELADYQPTLYAYISGGCIQEYLSDSIVFGGFLRLNKSSKNAGSHSEDTLQFLQVMTRNQARAKIRP